MTKRRFSIDYASKLAMSGLALVCVNFSSSASAATAAADIPMFVYKGAGCTGRSALPEFEKMVGRKVDGIVEFAANDSWETMIGAIDWSMRCWSKQPYKFAISVPMLLQKGTSLQAGARGEYDAHFTKLAQTLVKHGRGDSYLRIGWEFNGNWYPWAAQKDPAAFREFFRRIVVAMRSAKGSNFKIVWNPSINVEGVKPDAGYPGDDVVDVVALDVYSTSWRPQDKEFKSRWNYYLTQTYGLNWLRNFSIAHNKPVAIPEWGTGTRPGGYGYPNDAEFITNMAQWMTTVNMEFQAYWDYNAPDFQSKLSTGRYPEARDAFIQAFGKR